MYCLVVTDDYSRFTWVFFLATKDETSGILKSFITGIGNLVDHKVKMIRCDNGTEFKNREINQFCKMKGILRQFSVARTPQQNGVAERRNKTLIEAARTMLADSKLPTTFWTEALNTACYVQNRVLVVNPHNKTPYDLFHGRTPTLSFMRPFGCSVTIFNTIDHLGKFNGKADEGFLVGYSLNSKAFRVLNSRTRIVEENLHIRYSESTPNVVGSGLDWLFDIDVLTRTMNYEPIVPVCKRCRILPILCSSLLDYYSAENSTNDIGMPCRETIYLMYNLVRVSILSVSRVGMKCADLGSPVVTIHAFLKDLIYKVLGLQGVAPGINFDLEFLLGEWEGKASLEVRDMDTKLLSAPESNNTLARFLSQMAYLVASITLNSVRSCVMQSAFLTQGMVSTVVGVDVTVVVVVESSSVVKLSFVVT
ncbi:putative ribonuclease H-like domain-containing protein [Tanacetum coccineum]|uniref:Ribonuclease H-like domain-containing protein n=1 Tax=Tanacetum coccineum TaxID=301880 RepID=A0ABQ4XQQ3_9ASTR